MAKMFDIVTLSDRNGNGFNVRLGDFGITAILASLPTIFNLFQKTELTMGDLDQILPGAGYWTTSYKQYLKNHIKWKDQNLQRNILYYTWHFIIGQGFKSQYCQDIPISCWTSFEDVSQCPECYQRFNNVLNQEKNSGGISPVGLVPGGVGAGLDMNSLLIIGGGILALVLLSKKKK